MRLSEQPLAKRHHHHHDKVPVFVHVTCRPHILTQLASSGTKVQNNLTSRRDSLEGPYSIPAPLSSGVVMGVMVSQHVSRSIARATRVLSTQPTPPSFIPPPPMTHWVARIDRWARCGLEASDRQISSDGLVPRTSWEPDILWTPEAIVGAQDTPLPSPSPETKLLQGPFTPRRSRDSVFQAGDS